MKSYNHYTVIIRTLRLFRALTKRPLLQDTLLD